MSRRAGAKNPTRKAAAPKGKARGRTGPQPPDPSFDAPLHELGRDPLSVLLYLALLPEETAELVKELGLSQPGFRREALGEVQRCDLLADEIRAVPERRAAVLGALRKGWERPALATWPLSPAAAADLLDACSGEGALPLALWRVLADPAPEVRAEAGPLLESLARHHYGPPGAEGEGGRRQAAEDPLDGARRQAEELGRRLEEASRKLEQVEARGESARRKGEEAREKLQSWLKEARAREASAVDEAARARELADAAQREAARTREELAQLRAQEPVVEAQRLRGAVQDLGARAASLEARLERARERERELEAELDRWRAAGGGSPEPAAAADQAEAEPEEAPASWLLPVYTREFYDSLEGWDRRIQRAAFKQAALLAQDHRHPSLRALPLEGLPGYYRVRVATDVRLLYRRAEARSTVEILSLIDREDLDRYIKQAKTRS